MPADELDLPGWLSSTLAADAAGPAAVMWERVKPLRPGTWIAGRATPVGLSAESQRLPRPALAAGPQPGGVLVVGADTSPSAIMGGLVAAGRLAAGFRAVVTDGLIRDSAEVAASGLLVWCRGTIPTAPQNGGGGGIGTVTCGGVAVAPGDVVIADGDGVVVWPWLQVPELLERARAREASDRDRAARIARGDLSAL